MNSSLLAALVVVASTCTLAAETKAATWTDTPEWPADGGVLQLTWLVSPVVAKNPDDYPLAPLTLTATIGGVTRRFKLKPQMGSFKPYNQAVCETTAYPRKRDEVAKITFYEGGAGGYFVRRAGADGLAIVSWDQSDGACEGKHGEMQECPRRMKPAGQFHIPEGTKIRERIIELDAKGGRHAFTCTE